MTSWRSCSISLRLAPAARGEALERLEDSGLTGWRLYQVASEGKRPVCTLVRSV